MNISQESRCFKISNWKKKYKVNPTLLTTAADGIAEQLEQDPDRQSSWKVNGVAERGRCSAIAVTAAASAKK